MKISQRLQGMPPGPKLPPPIKVPLPEWLPDFPNIDNPGATAALNCIPKETGIYGPWRQPVTESTNAMDDRCSGAALAVSDAGVAYNYTGDVNKLYEYAGNLFSDASQVGGYTTPADGFWIFARYGTDIFATNYADPVQSVIVGDGATTKFADLITSVNQPKALTMGVIGQFLVLGNTVDATDGARLRRVWWSGFGDPTTFDPDAQTQSDFEDLSDGGNVTAVVGGVEYGVVFQTASITRMTYVGAPIIFRFDPVDRIRGCRYPKTIVSHGRLIFYWSDEGFMQFDGTTSRPIGAGKVDQTFNDLLTPDNAKLMTATKDTAKNLVIWGVPQSEQFASIAFIYNWTTGRWTQSEIAFDALTIGLSPGVLVDDLGGVIIDDEPFASKLIDSGEFRGGNLRTGGVNSSHEMVWLTGTPKRAEIASTEREIYPGQVAQVRAVTPYVDGTPLVQLTYRNKQTDNMQTTDEVTVGENDRAQFRDRIPAARYHSAKMIMVAGTEWDNARSFDVYADPKGIRVGN